MTAREGGCFCGAIRYRVEGEPTQVNHCHCRMCQRMSGAPIVTWATFKADDVRFLKGRPKWFDSSDKARRGFCANCGTQLLWRPNRETDEIDLTAASLDDPNSVRPDLHLWSESQLDWMKIEDGLPHYSRSRSEG
ncbi:MAG TPA: GFA family protein [Alphaproteobacteria bacterium]|nr:GFA family protein [Alphaproteobacteria bacterium]